MVKNRLKSNSGQAAIFLIMIFSFMFMMFGMAINVGMLVQHKINLQNSVDMAALAAASEQARVLNMMAWKNYELRKNYKSFLYNYWVGFNDRHIDFPDPRFSKRKARNIAHQGQWTNNAARGTLAVPSYCFGDIFGQNPSEYKACEASKPPGKFATVDPTMQAFASFSPLAAATLAALNQMAASSQARSDDQWNNYTQTNKALAGIDLLTHQISARKIYRHYFNENTSGSLTSILNAHAITTDYQNSTLPIPKSYQAFNATIGGNQIGYFAHPLNEPEPHNFHFLAYKTAYNNLNDNNRISFNSAQSNFQPIKPASGQYVRVKKGEINNFQLFFTSFTPGNTVTIQRFNPINVASFIVGVQKDPSVPTFYALKISASPELPFLPNALPWKLTAMAAAQPFGSRIGPEIEFHEEDYIKRVSIPGGTARIPFMLMDDSGLSIDNTQVLHDLKLFGHAFEKKSDGSTDDVIHQPLLVPTAWERTRYLFQTARNALQSGHATDSPSNAVHAFSASDISTSWNDRDGYSVKLIPLRSLVDVLEPGAIQTAGQLFH